MGRGEERIMAGSVNKVILVGNLGKDPEVRRLNSGDQVVNFTVATSETWRDKNSGERKETHRVAQCRDLQRKSRQGRRAILQEGHEGLRRGPAADAQMAGPGAATTATRPRLCCSASAANCNCSTRAAAGPTARASRTRAEAARPASIARPRASAARRFPAAEGARARGRSTTTFRSDLPLPLMLSLSKQREGRG